MQLQIQDGYITGYATLGGFVGGIDAPPAALDGCDADALRLYCYRWENGAAVLDADKLAAITAQQQADEMRARREVECFAVVNRGELWYARLTDEQRGELDAWYQDWLDAPQTGIAPDALDWLPQGRVSENEFN